jgi:voltage-gated potassium channel
MGGIVVHCRPPGTVQVQQAVVVDDRTGPGCRHVHAGARLAYYPHRAERTDKMMNSMNIADDGMFQRLRRRINTLYHGHDRPAHIFRWSLLAFDCLTILYFVIASFYHHIDELHVIEEAIGIAYLVEFLARLYISPRRLHTIFNPVGLADLIVIASLLAPSLAENYSFLRVIRALRLLRSYHMIKTLREQSRYVRLHEDVIFSVVNLLVFIFVITAVVYVTQVGVNPAIRDYVDALYFTVTTLTTTGFGDVTLVGTGGRILAVLIMIFGISLFLRLIQTIFRPGKVRYECPTCGLSRHDNDAVHCKHCGTVLHITTEGWE